MDERTKFLMAHSTCAHCPPWSGKRRPRDYAKARETAVMDGKLVALCLPCLRVWQYEQAQERRRR